jgi:hypothetical protein
LNRRAFLTGAAAAALTPMLPKPPLVIVAGPAMGKTTAATYEIFASELLRKIAAAYGLPYDRIAGGRLLNDLD